MKEAEWHLREWGYQARIRRLTAERDTARNRNRLRAGMRLLRCIYCGERTRCVKRPAVCPSHESLLALDPLYSPESVAA